MAQTLCRVFQIIIFYLVITTELFTAMVEMEDLLDTEAALIEILEKYIKIQDDKLAILKKKMVLYQLEHNATGSDIRAYISNPINAFKLTKRLTTDWKEIEHLIWDDVGGEFLENVANYRDILKFPTDEDLNDAAVVLTRLQDTYNLETSSVARGELNGIQYSSRMSASDCFELGLQTYINEDYYHTVLWMREAMQHLTEEENAIMAIKSDILEYLAFSIYKQGNLDLALNMTNELLELRPDHADAITNKAYFEQEMAKIVEGENVDHKSTILEVTSFSCKTDDRPKYEMLCRNEIRRPERELAKLHCRYVTNKSPFLKIAPIKLEEAHLDPFIVIYHEIMYDTEIDVFMKLAKPRFVRPLILNETTGMGQKSNVRTGSLAWLIDDDHRYIRNVGRRVEDMTGLTIETAEVFQVVNYGIGGHYEPHFDFLEPNYIRGLKTRNRIATVLFYMSDVEQGGATVFPKLETALWPKKGTAAFWMNMYKSGEQNILMKHAACPVLMGKKWVATKWLHEAGQEWNWPCGLQPDHPTSE